MFLFYNNDVDCNNVAGEGSANTSNYLMDVAVEAQYQNWTKNVQ